MRSALNTLLLIIVFSPIGFGQEPPDTNYDESRVPKYELPNPLVCFDGRTVTDAKTWREKRRPEILRAFETHMYGKVPPLSFPRVVDRF